MKHIETQSDQSGSHADPETEARDSIEIIKKELVRYHGDIIDDGLRHRVQQWLLEANEVPGGNLESYVTGRLSELRSENAMYHQRQHDDGTEAFPEACKECPHYGSRCPVLTDNTQINRRKRLIRNADSPDDLRHELREYAIDNECVVLLDVLERLSDHHEPLLRRGIMLLAAVEESMVFDGDERVARLKAALDTLGDDPTADVISDLQDDLGVDEDETGASSSPDVTGEDIEAEMERLTDGGSTSAESVVDDTAIDFEGDPWGFGEIDDGAVNDEPEASD